MYANLEDWMSDPNNVYIGRAGIVFVKGADGKKRRHPSQASPWHNPYKVSSKGYTRREALDLYRDHLIQLLEDEEILDEFIQLKGKTLGCWCKPDRCHGDIIVEVLNSL